MAQPFYITTPIYYVNARPHLGHAYTTIVADVVKRYHQARGEDAFFLTGTDEHGDKVVRAARAAGKTPREFVDEISGLFRGLWPHLEIDNDKFIRTTDNEHVKVVTDILQRIYDKGEIYFAEYEGLYCFGCERFYAERELVDGKCPDHETEPETIKESNYFFRMSKYRDWLIDQVTSNPGFIHPERYRNEVLAFLREPLEDLCISRPKSRLKWGITLPFDNNYVCYVWFDALVNYVSALGWPDGELYKKYWPAARHLVAKDILKPHGIYWPTMLKAADIPVYQSLNVHGYWNVEDSKMSKSLGNVIEPLALCDKYGVDAFRYFLMREMSFGLDSSFSEVGLIQRLNADLANDLGNLFTRVLTMVHKYRGGIVPETDTQLEKETGWGLEVEAVAAERKYSEGMEEFAFHKALMAAWEFISHMNKYVDVTQPWVLARQKEAERQLDVVLYNMVEGLRIVAGWITPVMPNTAGVMLEHLGLSRDAPRKQPGFLSEWGGMPAGTQLGKAVQLFPRVDMEEAMGSAPVEQEPAAPAGPPIKEQIDFGTFQKVDLRVGRVLEAEKVPKSGKLLKLKVDIGEIRTVVAGIAKSYKPEELVGRQVVVVANLAPAKLMGIESQGMVLAAVDEDGPRVLGTEREAAPGTPVS
ncbi:MAG: methionine--tRNA ligase [Desulfatibacillaceae bacterium]